MTSSAPWESSSLLLALSCVGCALFQRPAVVPIVAAPVIHVSPAPDVPQYEFVPGPDLHFCLTFEGFVAQQEENAKLYARLSYFKTLLIQYGAIFDEAPPTAKASP